MQQRNDHIEFKKLLDEKKFEDLKYKTSQYLEKNPNDQLAIEFLGFAHFSLREFKNSKEILTKGLLIEPNSYISLVTLARIACECKEFEQGVELYEKIIKIYKQDYEILTEYASLLIDLNKINLGIKILNKAIELNTQLFKAYSLMGKLFLKSEKFVNAITYFSKALKINPKNYHDISNIGLCYYKLEKISKAKQFFLKTISENPNYATGYTNLGLVHQTEGNFSEAIICYEKSLTINAQDAETYRLLTSIKKLRLEDSHVIEMEKLYKSEIPQNDKMLIGFGLAKVMEDNNNYQSSSIYLIESNNIRQNTFSPFDINTVDRQFDLIIQTFSKDFYLKNKFNFDFGITPIFIVGMPRSGSTLVEQILSSHPTVYGCGEINEMTNSINQIFPDHDSSIMLAKVRAADEKTFEKIGKNYSERIKKLSNKLIFTDKMLLNFKILILIKICIPNAKIIHCYRNANDNLLSIYKNYFSSQVMPWAYNQEDLKAYYQCYKKIMYHYKNILKDAIFDLNYDALTANPKDEIEKLLTFCNLDWNDACLNVQANNKPIFTASITQARSQINNRSFEVWKKFQNFLPNLFFKE